MLTFAPTRLLAAGGRIAPLAAAAAPPRRKAWLDRRVLAAAGGRKAVDQLDLLSGQTSVPGLRSALRPLRPLAGEDEAAGSDQAGDSSLAAEAAAFLDDASAAAGDRATGSSGSAHSARLAARISSAIDSMLSGRDGKLPRALAALTVGEGLLLTRVDIPRGGRLVKLYWEPPAFEDELRRRWWREVEGDVAAEARRSGGSRLRALPSAAAAAKQEEERWERVLARAAPVLRRKLARRLQVRFMPEIRFVRDEGLSDAIQLRDAMARIEAEMATTDSNDGKSDGGSGL